MSKTAFIFAGQGSQHVGMWKGGEKGAIYDLMRAGPEEELNKTVNAQQAVFLLGLQHAKALSIKPDVLAGFSLGEITALCYAGVIDDSIIKVRGEAMQKCFDKKGGAMIAVLRLAPEKVKEICKQFKEVWPVNFNSPDQTVCACASAETDKFAASIEAAGGRTIRLKVSGAAHCPYLNEASKEVADYLSKTKLNKPKLPVYSNVTGKPYGDYSLISKQITSPVLWQQSIENMIADGVTTFVECGPGRVLCGLVKKIAEAKGVEVKILKAEDLISMGKEL